MPIFFSIVPPPIGTNDVNVPLIPNVEKIIEFSTGDLGISDTINKDFLYKTVSLGKFPDPEAGGLFSNFGGFETELNIEEYRKKGSDRYSIPKDDMTLNGDELMGLKSIEKTIIQSIFETQKPYMEYIPTIVKTLAKLEDIAAKVLGSSSLSRKPKYNRRSLTYKLKQSTESLDQMKNFAKNKSNPFKDIDTDDKINGNVDLVSDLSESRLSREEAFSTNNLDSFEWEIISTEYSTGEYIPSIEYKEIYRNIIDPAIVLDSTKDPDDPIEEEDKPATIVFGYYDTNGNVKSPPTQWLDRVYSPNSVGPGQTKWFGEWEQLENNDHSRYIKHLREYVDDRLIKRLGRRDPELSNKVFNFIEPKIDSREFVEKANEFCFMNMITKTGDDEGIGIGTDSSDDVDKVTNGRKKTFLPKKINFNGKQVFVDPEADYELQIIKIVPTKDIHYNGQVDVHNQNLKKTTPIVGNYMGINVRDALTKKQYDVSGYNVSKPTTGEPRRVQIAYKYNYNVSNTSSTSHWDNEVAYVIEGIRRVNPDKIEENKVNGISDEQSEDTNNLLGWYNKWSIFAVVKDFVDILIQIFTLILPDIKSLIKLFKSPHEFIFDTIFEKMETNFSAFSSILMEKYRSLDDFDDKFEKEKFINSDPDLKKFVFLDEDMNHRFVLDGFAGMELLGFNFGINMVNFFPKMVLDKTNNFSLNQEKKSINGNFLPTQPNNSVTNDSDDPSRNGGSTPNSGSDNINASVRKQQNDGSYEWETISTEYSTGNFIKGVDYDYIYITEDVERLLSKGDDLFEAAIRSNDNGLDNAVDALTNYNMALDKDPNNKAIKDKIDKLKSQFGMQVHMILQMLINIVSFPMKIVISMLEEFEKFFSDIVKLITIPGKLEDMLSFGWIKKYVKPTAIMEFIGLRFNPELLFTWLNDIKDPNFDPDFEFDLSEIVGAPFLFALPKVNKDQLEIMATKPLEMMSAAFKLIEMLIEKILCFIFHTFSIDTIIDCPKFEISKFASANLPLEDLQALLNGDSSMLNSNPGSDSNGSNVQSTSGSNSGNVPYKFVYDVKLSDGTIISELNYAELQNFIKTNQEFNYEVKY